LTPSICESPSSWWPSSNPWKLRPSCSPTNRLARHRDLMRQANKKA
jgi:hypothetical protein